ncbi:MAG: dihydroorotase, partial [Pseudomonadota bacterium]
EVIDPEIDIFDRARVVLDRHLRSVTERFPDLRVVVEHVTTREAVHFVETGPATLAATITPQHLIYNRNALLAGGIRPHHYCLPVLKRESHRTALIQAATGGSPKFFLGTDSAPHPRSKKESACGCAGCYSAHAALELYAEVFENAGALDKLEGFASLHGAAFYRLPHNSDSVTLEKADWTVPDAYPLGDEYLVPLKAEQTLAWRFLEE